MLKGEEKQKNNAKKAKANENLYIKLNKEDFHDDDKHVLSSILGLLINSQTKKEGSVVIHDRVVFKFIENSFEKLQRLFELHLKYFSQVEDFDLSKFEDSEEIEYLVQDHRFDILESIDIIIIFLSTSEAANKLSEGDSITNKINEFIKFNGIKKESLKQVIKLASIRYGDQEDNAYSKTL